MTFSQNHAFINEMIFGKISPEVFYFCKNGKIMNLLYIIWDIKPQILQLGEFQIRWYGILFALAFYLGYLIIQKIFKEEGKPDNLLDKLTMYMAVGTIAGARLGHVLFYQPKYYLENPIEIFMIWEGGLASHGAAFGILLSLWYFAKKTKHNYLWILDRIVIVVALAGFFIRTGNLMNSEIYGRPTELAWGFKFVQDYLPGTPINLIPASHPTQIYEGLSYLAIFFLLFFLFKKHKNHYPEGRIFGLFLSLLFSVRFLVEFIKIEQVDFEKYLMLNMGQLLSIPFILSGIYFIIRKKKTA